VIVYISTRHGVWGIRYQYGRYQPMEYSELINRDKPSANREILLRLSKDLKLKIRNQAAKEHKPMSYLIREMLDEGLEKRSKK
jgi:hypothetical protein